MPGFLKRLAPGRISGKRILLLSLCPVLLATSSCFFWHTEKDERDRSYRGTDGYYYDRDGQRVYRYDERRDRD